jgi:SAM-dependent methyltransferase
MGARQSSVACAAERLRPNFLSPWSGGALHWEQPSRLELERQYVAGFSMKKLSSAINCAAFARFWAWALSLLLGVLVTTSVGLTGGARGPDRQAEKQTVPGECPSTDGSDTPQPLPHYKGRPIAPVMGWQAWEWLVRPDRELWEQPEKVLDALRIEPHMSVADIGAGVGYFTLRIARRVPRGKVYATDVQPQMITLLKQEVQRAGLRNVVPIVCAAEDPKLPPASVDLALMVDVYHEIQNPDAVMPLVRKALKEDGRLVLVEYRAEDPKVPIKPEHRMALRQVRRELEAFGFRVQELHEFLPWQHIVVFGKKGTPARIGSQSPTPVHFPAVYLDEGQRAQEELWKAVGFERFAPSMDTLASKLQETQKGAEVVRELAASECVGFELDLMLGGLPPTAASTSPTPVLLELKVAPLADHTIPDAHTAGGPVREGWVLRWTAPHGMVLETDEGTRLLDASNELRWVLHGNQADAVRLTVRQLGRSLRLALDGMPVGGSGKLQRFQGEGMRLNIRSAVQVLDAWIAPIRLDPVRSKTSLE